MLAAALGSSRQLVRANAMSGVVAVAAGGGHTCVLTASGGVSCWGWNAYGQLGNGLSGGVGLAPVAVLGLQSGVIATSSGWVSSCALSASGLVKCWGGNDYGQLGNGTTSASTTPTGVSGLTNIQAISVGTHHACALTTAGGLQCWGRNDSGQLGNGTSGGISTTPVDVFGLGSGVAAVAAAANHTCALTTGGAVKCWGANGTGNLGDGTLVSSSTPVDVGGLSSGASAISAGGSSSCALITSGAVKCWGMDEFGQIGDGSTGAAGCSCRTPPLNVIGLSGATAVSVGDGHACVVTLSGSVSCWGYNIVGQLGDATSTGPEACMSSATPCSTVPDDVVGLNGLVNGVSSGNAHSCGRTSVGGVMCWGHNGYGQLGTGASSGPEVCISQPCSTTAVTSLVVKSVGGVTDLAAVSLLNSSPRTGNDVTYRFLAAFVALAGTLGVFGWRLQTPMSEGLAR